MTPMVKKPAAAKKVAAKPAAAAKVAAKPVAAAKVPRGIDLSL